MTIDDCEVTSTNISKNFQWTWQLCGKKEHRKQNCPQKIEKTEENNTKLHMQQERAQRSQLLEQRGKCKQKAWEMEEHEQRWRS